jgi:hypothetical protein
VLKIAAFPTALFCELLLPNEKMAVAHGLIGSAEYRLYTPLHHKYSTTFISELLLCEK